MEIAEQSLHRFFAAVSRMVFEQTLDDEGLSAAKTLQEWQ